MGTALRGEGDAAGRAERALGAARRACELDAGLTSAQALAAPAGALAGQREAAHEHAHHALELGAAHSGAGSASSCPEVEAVISSLRRAEVGAALIGLVLLPLGLQTE